MKATSDSSELIPLKMVGSTVFGRYPKISIEETFNMYISDEALVSYSGYLLRKQTNLNGEGRGIYSSIKNAAVYCVIDNKLLEVTPSYNGITNVSEIARIATYSGEVFIAENNNGQLAICDKQNIYIFNYLENTFEKAAIDFVPGYIEFHDSYFISVDLKSNRWRLSALNDGVEWPVLSGPTGGGTASLQSKADNVIAVKKIPSKGNLIFVFGSTVTELWQDTGGQLFPYQRNSYSGIDFGCLNAATIATNDNIIVWLGYNEKSGPTILSSNGGEAVQISNDGINYVLSQLRYPEISYGFLFKQDGHVFYQITFPEDNLSYCYDFTTEKFFTLTDNEMNYHIARQAAFFGNSYYFVSYNDGGIYELNSKFTTYSAYNESESRAQGIDVADKLLIPRVRVTNHIRKVDQSWFVANNVTFTIEQGQGTEADAVHLSVSKDGGESFGGIRKKNMNKFAKRQGRMNFWGMGRANDLVLQFRFWTPERVVVKDGTVSALS